MRPDSTIQWSAYPALLLFGAFAVGISLATVMEWAHVFVWGGSAAAGVVLVVLSEWWDRRRMVSLAPLGRVTAILVVAVCAGGARSGLYQQPSPASVEQIAEANLSAPLWITGTVDDAPEHTSSSTRFTMAVDTVGRSDARSVAGKIRVTLQPSPWNDHPADFPHLHQGDRLRLHGSIESPTGQRNPGGFDYAGYLSRRGICCTTYVGQPAKVVVLSRNSGVLNDLIVAARQYLRGQIHRYVPTPDGQAVLQALLLGDRSRISDAQEDRFKTTGLMHLLAVSGLHVFMVGMVFYMLLRPVLMRFRLGWWTVESMRAGMTVVVLGFYMVLTGSRPSVVRAVVMSALFIGGILFQRSSHPLNTLGVAALVLLVIRPPALFDVGFQLSMAAVSAIVTIHPRLMDLLPEGWNEGGSKEWLAATVSTTAAATIGTAPVLLSQFGWVSGAGLLLNVFGIPCTALALSSAVGMVIVGGIWTLGGVAFGAMAGVSVEGLLFTSRKGVEWLGWMGIRLADSSVWLIGALIVGAVVLAQWPRPRYRWCGIACVLLLLTGGIWSNALGPDSGPTLDLLFFDVGQGDAALITTPNDRRVLVDTGPRSLAGGAAVSHSVLQYLRRRGVDSLDTVVVTHPDEDHLGGVPNLLREVSVGRMVHSGQEANTELYRETRRLLRDRQVLSQAVNRGDTLAVDSTMRIQVLGPPSNPEKYGIEGENGASVVLHLSYGSTDVLLSGDVEARAERNLVRAYGQDLDSRVVKIPHHGSGTSSTPPFVRGVVDSTRRTKAVVSVGASNQFGMPDSTVLRRWRSRGASVYSTARRGAVWFRSDGSNVWRVDWKED